MSAALTNQIYSQLKEYKETYKHCCLTDKYCKYPLINSLM